MNLNLKRWNNKSGESSGWWLIQEMPGFMLFKQRGGWRIYCGDPYIRKDTHEIPAQTWGANYTPAYHLWPEQGKQLAERLFPTRREALTALQLALEPEPEPRLEGVLWGESYQPSGQRPFSS